jgi:hypothetical protein
VKKALLGLAVIAGLGVYWLVRSDEPKDAQQEASAVKTAGVAAAAPRTVYENLGSFHAVRASVIEAPTVVQLEERVGLGDTINLKFAVPREHVATGMGMNKRMTAKVFRGHDRPIELEVKEVGKGKFEVPFKPEGPGQFNVVLSDDGTPIAAQKVGVVGAVGANALSDPNALDEADPISFRARTPGRLASR